jgi:uncharacterized protein (TIGR00251 family)
LAAVWYRRAPDQGAFVLDLHIQPQSRRTEIAGLHGQSLKVRVAAPALDGRANEALLAFVADRFAVPRRDVTLLSGEKSRRKRLLVRSAGIDPETALAPEGAR